MGSLYEQDFIAWTEAQSRALREAARGGNLPLDWDNLAEEIAALGRSERRALASEVRRAILHLLKLEFSPASQPRAGWIASVADARAEIELRLRYDPGLAPRLSDILNEEAPAAAKAAARELRAYGEHAAAAQALTCAVDHYTPDQILGDWLPLEG